jgi:putative hydrolase of the HAD superfamily
MRRMKNSTAKWILFDLGNVLVEYRPVALGKVAGGLGVTEATLIAFLEETHISHKSWLGEISPEEFVAAVNTRYGSTLTTGRMVELFSEEVANVLPGIPDVIRSLKGRCKLGILSNTFFAHWDYFMQTELASHFDAPMASHMLRAGKPDRRIYERALAQINAAPAEVVFIDDRSENVEAACALGLDAFQSLTPADTVSGLRGRGLLD